VPPPRRVWCSCTIIYYLAGYPEAKPDCDLILGQGERGELEIVVPVLSEAEVVKIGSTVEEEEAERMIREFFGRDYIVRANLDPLVAQRARSLVRRYGPKIKPLDAVHIATALQHNIPLLETYDNDMISISGQEGGSSPLIIRRPTYEGTQPMFA
jgi:predicted nucleic acid-binding protein